MSHWNGHALQWGQVEAPLRPTAAVVAQLCDGLTEVVDPVLVLGVTPELTAALPRVLAVDRNPAMIQRLWPGDQPGRQVVCGDWLQLELGEISLSAVVGDGSLTVLGSAQRVHQLLQRLHTVLVPGIPLRCRLFVRPEQPCTLLHLHAISRAPGALNFHAFKWMLAMQLAASHHDQVPVQLILERFNSHWPNRDQLAADSGWPRASIDTIDVYHSSTDVYWFPTASGLVDQVQKVFTEVRLQPTTGYPLAGQCPILEAIR